MSTPSNLVIVESPAKAKTIEKFLGPDYRVMSSYGHIRDLKKRNFSIDVDNGFQPVYEIPDDKTQLVSELRKAAAQADTVWLASDEDREGEAIAWHLYEVLELKPENTRRIVFHEITKKAILNAIANPRDIDINRVDAQQARRVLDRIVGFELSPVLWKRLKPALSAGRVQSVAVRLIVERENEIKHFVSEPYYRVRGTFRPAGVKGTLRAELDRRLHSHDEAHAFLAACDGANFTIGDVAVKPLKKSPAPPFTTSTLQQEASRKLGFTVSQTMMVAQRLYENGHITYMRTDSLDLSEEAIAAISAEITGKLGERYLHVRRYHTKAKGAQEAHEAIRPTYIERATLEEGTAQEKRLYALIHKRAIASQMADAEIEKTVVDIRSSAVAGNFVATGEVVKFDGFLRVYIESTDDDTADSTENILPAVAIGDSLDYSEIEATERFTQQPPRYSEASLVKKMEELGIGRPSTYAPTISTIQAREYVARGEKEGSERPFETMVIHAGTPDIQAETRYETTGSEKGRLVPTDIGTIVNDFLTEYFPDILDYNFTARIEEKFDRIAEGELPWSDEIQQFYTLFHPSVEGAMTISGAHKFGERVLGKDPATGEPVSVKIGRYGPVVQIGESESERKPRFATLLKDQSVSTITLEEALKLFEFPRVLGTFEDAEVTVAVGRFGPYVRHRGNFVSIPKETAPTELNLDGAIELIVAKRAEAAKKIVREFTEDPDLQILNGRYGIYIAYRKKNYKIPKTVTDPAALTFEQAMKIVSEADAAPEKPRRSAAGRHTKK